MNSLNSPTAKSARTSGQSLVEFSLMMIILLFVLQGVIDIGRMYFTYLAVKDAAGEGTYFLAAYPSCLNDTSASTLPGCTAPNNMEYRVRNSAPTGGFVSWENAAIEVTTNTIQTGQYVTVAVSYQYELMSPLIGAVIGGRQTFTLTATSIGVIIRVPNCAENPCK